MSKHTAPAVSLDDVRAWEKELEGLTVQYHYTVVSRGPGRPVWARTALMWVPVPGVQFVLLHEGEVVHGGRVEAVTGAWIRCAARIHDKVSRESVAEMIRLVRWQLDGKLPAIRG